MVCVCHKLERAQPVGRSRLPRIRREHDQWAYSDVVIYEIRSPQREIYQFRQATRRSTCRLMVHCNRQNIDPVNTLYGYYYEIRCGSCRGAPNRVPGHGPQQKLTAQCYQGSHRQPLDDRSFADRRFRGIPARSHGYGLGIHGNWLALPATAAASRPAIPMPLTARRWPVFKGPATLRP